MLKQTFVGMTLLFAAHTASAAKTCTFAIEGTDQMKFNVSEIRVAADCTEVQIKLKHVGRLPVAAMGHNWVLTKTPDFMGVVNDGMKAGATKGYLPVSDKRVIAHTDLIGGGQITSVTFHKSALTKGGDYTFFCSFPGHFSMMKGKLIVQ